jgi:glycerophosphoryl diester phosphodiesterase
MPETACDEFHMPCSRHYLHTTRTGPRYPRHIGLDKGVVAKMPENHRSRTVFGGPTQVIAHRGASARHPENTIAAFRAAKQEGADMVELDVRATADGRLAVHHDAHLADGRPIAALAAGDLPPRVPLLAQALDACAGMRVNVEIKSNPDEPGFDPERRLAGYVVALARQRDALADLLVSSFDWDMIASVRARETDLPTAYLVARPADDLVARVAAAGHRALHPWFGFVTHDLIRRCHDAGLAVNCWTCDDPERMVELAGWGVDGICTNDPALAVHVLRHD